MKIIETPISGLLIIEPNIYSDIRGYFFESWHAEHFTNAGIKANFVQDNESKSVKGVVRGLHYQLEPWSQAKLVRVVEGNIFDVAVDLRKNSPTFGKWFGLELDSMTKKQLFIPRGFAHGFSVLSETAVFSYKCDNFFNRSHERSIHINDPELEINWRLKSIEPIISDKDQNAPFFKQAEMNF
jgi:dTDP-4-dehydrorhamnose 3,5-epimerase